jgi:hypothetical protein
MNLTQRRSSCEFPTIRLCFQLGDFLDKKHCRLLSRYIWGASVQFQPTCCGRSGARPREGLMIGWLLLAVLGMIWAAFLIPSWRRSPTSTVEAFEERMSLLAEANRASPGRWVLVPMKGRRFLGPQDRQRARMRRRRRFLFVALLDLIGLTFLMGLFQPLRSMWVASAILVCLLVVYVVLLIRLRMVEMAEAERSPATASYADAFANGDGHATGSGNGH